MDEVARTLRLRRESARLRIAFIETDIDVGITFLRLALTELEMSNLARVDELLVKARIAYEATAKLLPEVAELEEWQRLRDEHEGLADALREVERRRRRHEDKNP